MIKFTLFLTVTLSLFACTTSQPTVSYDDTSIDGLLKLREQNKDPIGITIGKDKKTEQPKTNTQTIYTQGLAGQSRKEGVLSFEEWKKAKEANSKEYQEYLEYREYLQTLSQ